MVTAPDIPGHRVGGVLGAGGFATVALLRASLSPDPAARPQSAVALRDALAGLHGHFTAAPPAPVWQVSAPARDGQPGTPSLDRQVSMSWSDRTAGTPSQNSQPTTSARHRQAVPSDAGAARRWLSPRHLGLSAGLIVIIAVALLAGVRLLPHGASPGAGGLRRILPGADSRGARAAGVPGRR